MSLALIVLFAPVFLIVAVVVRVWIGSPVLFSQMRPGRCGRPFFIRKFRTMRDDRHANGDLLPDESRLSQAGRILRATSLDELPELWNVLIGEMSLVGPRPLRMEYLDRYTPTQAGRHDVTPGLTGWAQVNGRNGLSWEKRFELDLWYVDHVTFWLDLKIMFRTISTVLTRDGVSPEGSVTMPEFNPAKSDDTQQGSAA